MFLIMDSWHQQTELPPNQFIFSIYFSLKHIYKVSKRTLLMESASCTFCKHLSPDEELHVLSQSCILVGVDITLAKMGYHTAK